MTMEERAAFLVRPSRFAQQRLGFEPDAKQREVLDTASKRVLLNCSRQWGKSTITAVKAVHRAYTQPNSLVLVAAPVGRQSAEFVRKASGFVKALGLRVRGDGDNESSLLLPNGSRIVGLPSKADHIRGFSSVSLLVIDEAAMVPDEVYYTVRPMLIRSDGDMVLMSTPKGKQGFFWKEWVDSHEDWLRVMAPVTECSWVGSAFLESERRRLPEKWFAQEYMCEFTQREGAMFREEDVLACLRDDIEPLVVR